MTRDELLAASRERNVAAFLRVIRACEGTAGDNGYRMLFGGEVVASLADHPRKLVIKSGYKSTAAGAYQFLERTWDGLVRTYQFPSFEPQWQDAGAVGLILGRKALDDVRAGRLDEAVEKCSREWASLPGSPYGQPVKTMEFVRKVFAMHSGTENQVSELGLPNLHTAPPAVPPINSPDKPMSPFIIPALDMLVRAVPTIADLFKGEAPSKVAERNIDAVKVIADKVIPIVLEASGQTNVQAAAEAAVADPKVAADMDAAARREYFELQRVSVKEARDFAMQYAQTKDVRTVVGRFTFLEVLSLTLLLISSAFGSALLYLDLLKGELLGAIVMLVVVAGFSDIRRFWLGLPASEPPKD